MGDLSRRRLLQTGGAALAGATAGCLSGVRRAVHERTSGRIRWITATTGFASDLAAVDGRLLVGTLSGVEAFTLDGERVWARQFEDPDDDTVSRPGTVTAAPGVVVTREFGRLQALAPADGATLWTRDVSRGVGEVAARGDRVFLGGDGIASLDATSGDTTWDVDRRGGRITLAGDRLYAAGDAGVVHALDAASGDHRWSVETGARTAQPGVAPGGDVVFVGTSTPETPGTLFALDAADGSRRWQAPLEQPADIFSAPAVSDDRVVVASFGTREGLLSAYDRADGRRTWTRPSSTWRYAHPVIADGTVYVHGNAFLALDAATGEVDWRYDAVGSETRPIIDADVIYTTSEHGVSALERT